MAKPKTETKKVTLAINTKAGARELVKLREQGWEVVSEHKRGALEWKPGQIDYVLTRTTGDQPGPAPSTSLPDLPPPLAPANWYPDPIGGPGTLRYWDGVRWTERTHDQ